MELTTETTNNSINNLKVTTYTKKDEMVPNGKRIFEQ